MAKCAYFECSWVNDGSGNVPELINDYAVSICDETGLQNIVPDPNSTVFAVAASDAEAAQIDADNNYDGANLSGWIDYDPAIDNFQQVLKVWLNG